MTMPSVSLADILTEPQRQMAAHLRAHPRAIAFVGMGVGKTAATLAALDADMENLSCGRALVVAPLRVATCTWPAEVARWAPWMRVCDARSPKGYKQFLRGDGFDLAVVNWENLDKISEYLTRTRTPCIDTIVFDELSCAKAPDSKRPKRMAAALEKHPSIRRWGLTGTLMPNGPMDLWGQSRLIDSSILGNRFPVFRERYFFPTDYMRYNWAPRKGEHTTREILGELARITLTIRSQDWLDVPEPEVLDLDVSLPAEAMAAYTRMEKTMMAELEGGTVVAETAAVVVNKLLQFASGAVYGEDRTVHTVHEAKVAALARYAAENPTENLLVAANYRHEYERVRSAIPGAVLFDGTQSSIVDAWNAGKIRALVAHPKSIGHGLNLQHGGRTVVWFSPTWSQEMFDQFNARVARRGQERQPRIVRIVAKGTIDEAVLAVIEDKTRGQNMAKEVLQALRSRL